jgi:tetratricopeptide (TPR) repeat protein
MTLVPSHDLRLTLDDLGTRFLQEFLEVEIGRHPENIEALVELGQVYTTRGLWDEGLKVDLRLIRLLPASPTAHYNLACSYALLKRTDAALEALEQAVELGYDDGPFMAGDADLASLRTDCRFQALIEHLSSMA